LLQKQKNVCNQELDAPSIQTFYTKTIVWSSPLYLCQRDPHNA
jgi:hypothetical protein